jgi:hypothetical protein
MPQYVGNIDREIVKNIVRHYKDLNFDLDAAKDMLIDLVDDNYNIDSYTLNLCSVYGLKLCKKNDDGKIYMFCKDTGHIYYASSHSDYYKMGCCWGLRRCLSKVFLI